MITLKKGRIEIILDYLLVFMLVINSQSVYQNSTEKNYYTFEITFALIIICTLFKLLKYGIGKKKLLLAIGVSMLYFIYIFCFVLISVDFDQIIVFGSRYFILPFVLLYFFSQKNNDERKKFFMYYINVVCFVSVVSVFFWTFGTFLHIISPTNLFAFEWGSVKDYASYYNIYFETQWIDWLDGDLKRNTAIFVEGPCFAVVLCFALLFIYFFKEQVPKYKLKIFIVSVAVLTTFSVTSYAFLIVIFVLIISNNPKLRKIIYTTCIPVLIVCFVVIMIMKTRTGSFALRSGDVEIVLRSWSMSPIVGNGYVDADYLSSLVTNRKNLAVASSIGVILMQGGIMFLLLYLVPIATSLKIGIKKHQKRYIVASLSYLLLLFVVLFQTFYINFFMWVFLLFIQFFDNEKAKVA